MNQTAYLCIWTGAWNQVPAEAHDLIHTYGGHTSVLSHEGAVMLHAQSLAPTWDAVRKALGEQ